MFIFMFAFVLTSVCVFTYVSSMRSLFPGSFFCKTHIRTKCMAGSKIRPYDNKALTGMIAGGMHGASMRPLKSFSQPAS